MCRQLTVPTGKGGSPLLPGFVGKAAEQQPLPTLILQFSLLALIIWLWGMFLELISCLAQLTQDGVASDCPRRA